VTIFNTSFTEIDGLSGQKLIFRSFLYAKNLPCYSTNIEKKCDIRDQHILFYRSIKKKNEKKTKSFSRIPEGDLRLKKFIFYEICNKVVKTIRVHRASEIKVSFRFV
jgi:hypothetical protein